MGKYLQNRNFRKMDGHYSRRNAKMMYENRDMRNPYGSKGGYVVSKRDRGMDHYNANSERGGRYYDGNRSMPMGERNNMDYKQYREPMRPMEFDIYGGIMPYSPYYYDGSMGETEQEWEEDLDKWCRKLKKFDKFNMSKDEILSQASAMGVEFKDFTEKEYLATYYMLMSDYDMDMLNSPQAYMIMAKKFLEDYDSELVGGDKLCAYYYEVILGGE